MRRRGGPESAPPQKLDSPFPGCVKTPKIQSRAKNYPQARQISAIPAQQVVQKPFAFLEVGKQCSVIPAKQSV